MRKNKGITLIALVITIIVLLILAGVSIATLLGENGILNQATKAVEKTNSATEKEKVQLACNAQMSKNAEKGKYTIDVEDINDIQEELDSLKAGAKITENSNPIEVVFPNGNIYAINNGKVLEQAKVGEKVTGKNKAYTNNGTAIIPEGFTIVPGCDDVSEGLVISDDEGDTEEIGKDKIAEGNQFVWVPVKNFDEFKRENGYLNGNLQSCNFVSDEIMTGKWYEPEGDGETVDEGANTIVKEAQEMYKSVKDNGGFYIGRYETGTTEANGIGIRGKMVCKKGVTVYNSIKWGNSINDEKEAAIKIAREFATQENYTSVTSTLCYGVQWDAVMKWMKDIDNINATNEDVNKNKYIIDSTKMGWYKENYTEGNADHKTGIDIGSGENNKSNKVKNIYDMAGNVAEVIMEVSTNLNQSCRGGAFCDSSVSYSMSNRGNYNGSQDFDSYYGFRVTLYL